MSVSLTIHLYIQIIVHVRVCIRKYVYTSVHVYAYMSRFYRVYAHNRQLAPLPLHLSNSSNTSTSHHPLISILLYSTCTQSSILTTMIFSLQVTIILYHTQHTQHVQVMTSQTRKGGRSGSNAFMLMPDMPDRVQGVVGKPCQDN